MTSELLDLVDDEGKLLPYVKDELIQNFFESTDGKDLVMGLYISMMSFSLTEFMDVIRKENPDMKLSSVVDSYCKNDAEYSIFSWFCKVRRSNIASQKIKWVP